MKAEAVKLSGLTLGTSAQSRVLYQRVAESLSDDPFVLREYVDTLKRAHADRHKQESEIVTQSADGVLFDGQPFDGFDKALAAINQLNKTK